MNIKTIQCIKPGEKFMTEFGVVYTCDKVGMMSYPALLLKEDCIPVPAITAQENKYRFWIIELANLTKVN